MSPRYNPDVVVVQAGSRSAAYSAPSSSTYSSSPYARSTLSMDSSSASRSTTEARYRSGSSTGYYTGVKEVPSSRGGQNVVVIQHNRANPDEDEPRSSDYKYSRSSYSKK